MIIIGVVYGAITGKMDQLGNGANSELTDNTEIGFDIDIPELTEIPDFSDL